MRSLAILGSRRLNLKISTLRLRFEKDVVSPSLEINALDEAIEFFKYGVSARFGLCRKVDVAE